MAAPALNPQSNTYDVNVLGTKAKLCSFDCAYCDLGATEVRLNKLKDSGLLPTVEDILADAQTAFRLIHERGPMVSNVTLSGNGEPTLHPDFPEIVAGLVSLRNIWLEGVPLVLVTNGSALDQRRIAEAANKLDQRIVKIDAGNEKLFKAMNAPLSRVTLQKVLSGARLMKNLSIQAMFHQGSIDNTGSSDIEDWMEVVGLLKPTAVYIQGLSRKPHGSGLIRCDEDTLHTIASKLERRTGIKAIVTP